MNRIHTLIIGGGQAGLAMSYELMQRGIDCVVLERGLVAQRWRTGSWDSLRLLTPNWLNRLPGWSCEGAAENGYLSKDELIAHLSGYASSFDAPVECGEGVESVEKAGDEFLVQTSRRLWLASNVVIATGHCMQAKVPGIAGKLSPDFRQLLFQ